MRFHKYCGLDRSQEKKYRGVLARSQGSHSKCIPHPMFRWGPLGAYPTTGGFRAPCWGGVASIWGQTGHPDAQKSMEQGPDSALPTTTREWAPRRNIERTTTPRSFSAVNPAYGTSLRNKVADLQADSRVA